jgi:uncharacterized protein YhhL (DUF1145 family)
MWLLALQLVLIAIISSACLIELINSPQITARNMLGKLAITALWMLLIASFFTQLPNHLNHLLYWIAFLLIAMHAMECISLRKQIRRHHRNLFAGYLLVFLYGGLHASQWPAWQAENSQPPAKNL